MELNTSYVLAMMVLFALIETGILFVPVSTVLLLMYRRSVIRGMRRCASGSVVSGAPEAPRLPARTDSASFRIVEPGERGDATSAGAELYRRGSHQLKAMIADHIVAGAAYVAVWTAGMLWILPATLRVVMASAYAVGCAFPAILAWTIITLPRKTSLFVWTGYFVVLATMFVWAIDQTSTTTDATAAFGLLSLFFYPLILVGTKFGGAGPLVGASLGVVALGQWFGIGTLILVFTFWWIPLGAALGLSDIQTTGFVLVLQMVVFSIPTVFLLRAVKSRYQRKRTSDQSLTIDAAYVFSSFLCAGTLAASSVGWRGGSLNVGIQWPGDLTADIRPLLLAPLALAAYKLVLRAALAKRFRPAPSMPPPDAPYRLLLLRAFSLRGRGRRMFRTVERFWRHVGPLQLISGPDLALSTVEPHEFLDFVSLKLNHRFVETPAQVDTLTSSLDSRPDPDGRYRVIERFCRDDTWRAVFSQLASSSDAILMDVRGFTSNNSGCAFELSHLLTHAPAASILLLVDDETDMTLIGEHLAQSGAGLFSNAVAPDRQQVTVYWAGHRARSDDVLRFMCEVAVTGRLAMPSSQP